MADTLPNSHYYKNLGGVNLKASSYEMSTAQFLDIRNMDFDAPNALQKRPGTTFVIGTSMGTSGPIISLFEYTRLTGESLVIAASDTALFYIASGGLTLLSPGWNNGQPPDMLTFVNKLWAANGQSWISWNGVSAPVPTGLPTQTNVSFSGENTNSATFGNYSVFGLTMTAWAGTTTGNRAVLIATYAYLRKDGYISSTDLFNNFGVVSPFFYEKNGISGGSYVAWGGYSGAPVAASNYGNNATLTIQGFTTPANVTGTSGYALFMAIDQWTGITATILRTFPQAPGTAIARLGYTSLISTTDVTKFKYFTSIPLGSTQVSFFGVTLAWNELTSGLNSFSMITPNFFTTYIPKYLEINQNVMFAAGFSSAPSTVIFSDVGAPEAYQPENFFEVRTNDGDRIYGIKAFNNQLIITKEHSFSKLIGDNADNFQLVELSTDFGCISNKTMLTKDQTLYWLDKKGILLFNGANWEIVSDAIEPIFRRMNLTAAKENAVGVHHLYRNQLWWGIPIDGSTQNNFTVVYDYLVNAWTFFDGFSPASFAYIQSGLNKPTVWRGSYSGHISYFGESFFSDSGRGISCVVFTRFENDGGENQSSIWRRLFLDVNSVGVSQPIIGKMYSNYDTTTVQATFTMYQNQFQSRAEMGVLGKSVAAQFSHSSTSLPFRINGYGFANRGLRNV